MKKCLLSAAMGAACMLLLIWAIRFLPSGEKAKEYVHTDFLSEISPADCCLCTQAWGNSVNHVGILNLNTFDILCLEISGVSSVAGVMQRCGMACNNSYVYAYVYPEYAQVQITQVGYEIERNRVQTQFCQKCLDTVNQLWFSGEPPAEYAIISFADRTLRPLIKCTTWFSAGNYGISCVFKADGSVDLLIHRIRHAVYSTEFLRFFGSKGIY